MDLSAAGQSTEVDKAVDRLIEWVFYCLVSQSYLELTSSLRELERVRASLDAESKKHINPPKGLLEKLTGRKARQECIRLLKTCQIDVGKCFTDLQVRSDLLSQPQRSLA